MWFISLCYVIYIYLIIQHVYYVLILKSGHSFKTKLLSNIMCKASQQFIWISQGLFLLSREHHIIGVQYFPPICWWIEQPLVTHSGSACFNAVGPQSKHINKTNGSTTDTAWLYNCNYRVKLYLFCWAYISLFHLIHVIYFPIFFKVVSLALGLS